MKTYFDYKKCREEKSKIEYDTIYDSSAVRRQKSTLGTIESDASGHFGLHKNEKFRGKRIFDILKTKMFTTVLDVGAGKLEATEEFIKLGKVVDICDFDTSYYFQNSTFDKSKINNIHIGDINSLDIPFVYDAIWCSHVLEHQLNPNLFLKKITSLLREGIYQL